MISSLQMGFIPSSIILKCLRMWKKFDCVPRLHVGMKLSTIIFLDPIHIEKISRKCGIDDGLIVIEVSEGSVAEELGIKAGDIIKRWNRKKISTTVELENLLLCLCEKHLDKKNVMGSNLDLLIDIFHVRKRSNDTIKLTVCVSNDVEKVVEGTYAVTKDNIRGHDDHKVHGEEASHGINDEEDGDTKKCTFSEGD
ncbi:hypothetical protein U9M48_021002 [Paspalum notatum var. saurae]|uniref:PDZ domain-containing protein n=1 Tax=Paspalum notatum var. saurae TaxID=547442 RepID=A0AAQ3WT60_PASNO